MTLLWGVYLGVRKIFDKFEMYSKKSPGNENSLNYAKITKYICSMGMDIQNGNGYATWTQTCRMDLDMDMQHERKHAAFTIKGGHGYGHIAWTWTIDMNLQHKHGRVA
jgi:hypothetical protein